MVSGQNAGLKQQFTGQNEWLWLLCQLRV